MLNEGIIANNTDATMRSEMLTQLQRLGQATSGDWERAVFESLTGHRREDVDWEFADNEAGYFTWVKAFDVFIGELVDDGFVRAIESDGTRRFELRETDPAINWSQLVGPTR